MSRFQHSGRHSAERRLLRTAADGNFAMARSLLETGARWNVVDRNGESVVHLAARHDAGASLIKMLAERGCDVSRANKEQQTPLMVAAAAGRVRPLIALLSSGAPIDRVNRRRETALTYAIISRRPRAVHALLRHGANVEKPMGAAWSPLMYAAFEGQPEVVKALLAHGASARRRDRYGRAPADIAESAKHDACASILRNAVQKRKVRRNKSP
jgi:ankyrin repeat protein